MRRPLRELMAERGITGAQLARQAAISKAAVSQILHGKEFPRWTTAQRIAAALGVRADSIQWPAEEHAASASPQLVTQDGIAP